MLILFPQSKRRSIIESSLLDDFSDTIIKEIGNSNTETRIQTEYARLHPVTNVTENIKFPRIKLHIAARRKTFFG